HRERHRQDRRNPGPNVGNEAQQRSENAPEHRVRHPDEVEPHSDDRAEAGVDSELDQKVTAEPASRLVHRDGRAAQVCRPEEPYHAVAQILTTRTMPALASGERSGEITVSPIFNAEGAGWVTTTGKGCRCAAAPGFGGAGVADSARFS